MKINVNKLEAERERLGLTKAAFSRKIGFKDSTYFKLIDSESTTLKRLSAIAKALGVNPKTLLS